MTTKEKQLRQALMIAQEFVRGGPCFCDATRMLNAAESIKLDLSKLTESDRIQVGGCTRCRAAILIESTLRQTE